MVQSELLDLVGTEPARKKNYLVRTRWFLVRTR